MERGGEVRAAVCLPMVERPPLSRITSPEVIHNLIHNLWTTLCIDSNGVGRGAKGNPLC